MMLICRPVGRGNWAVVMIAVDSPPDLFRFKPEHRFTWGDPPQTLRIVRVLP